jgi:putative heme-binding domain-containing protein
VDGAGGEGPALARPVLPRAPDDAALIRIMAAGIPGTAMSRSWWLSAEELGQIAAYVRSLAPHDVDELVSGDAERGQEVYARLGCDRCHTIGGFGTSRGPDLTTLGLRRGPTYLREAVLDPGAALPRGQTAISGDFVDYLPVRVVDADGTEVRGMRMNEDSYTIQVKDARGTLHSFYKPALRVLDKIFDSSLMRSYRDRLTDEEVDDLVKYLMSLTPPAARVVS